MRTARLRAASSSEQAILSTVALTILLNAIFPVVFHPVSRTIWVGVEMAFHPLEPGEEIEAATHGTGQWSVESLATNT